MDVGVNDGLSPIQQVEANAQLVLDMARDQFALAIACDRDGVVWLNQYIEQQHQQGDPNLHDQLVSVLGSFLGQCVVQTHGGSWQKTDGQWAVVFSPGHAVYPFEKVRKHLAYGQANGDAVLPFFDAIPALFGLENAANQSQAHGWISRIRHLLIRTASQTSSRGSNPASQACISKEGRNFHEDTSPKNDMAMKWLAPWYALTDDRQQSAAMEQELARELPEGHELSGLPMAALARRDGSDDVLFQITDGSGRVAMIHLTWTSQPPEQLPWPGSTVYASLEAWAEAVMRVGPETFDD